MYHSHYFFLTKISLHFGSSGFVGGFRRLRLSNCGPYEGFVAVGIDVDIGMFAVRVDFLQQMAAVSNETGLVFEVVPA